jgi:hypothetical protein
MNREYEDRPRREDGPRRDERTQRHFRGDGVRKKEHRADGPRPLRQRFDERPEKPERPNRPEKLDRHFRPRRPRRKQITKMFVTKEALVDYVNVEGEKGHQIDIYKIEENLYKVVKVEFDQQEKSEKEVV